MAGVSASAYDGSAGSGVLADPQKGGAVMGKRLENKVAIVTGAGQPGAERAMRRAEWLLWPKTENLKPKTLFHPRQDAKGKRPVSAIPGRPSLRLAAPPS